MKRSSPQKSNIFRRWYTLAEPSKKLWFWQVFFYVCYTVFLTVMTVFAAQTINCMYQGDWMGAFINLALELGTIVARSVFMHIQYKFYNDQVSVIRLNVAKKVYNKILSCENAGIKSLSKEKILHITINNVEALSDFPNAAASFIAYTVQIVITLVVVFVANYWAGLIVTVLGALNFVAYYLFNKRLGRIKYDQDEKEDKIFSSYSKIIDAKQVINEFHGKEQYEGELIDRVNDFGKTFTKLYMTSSWKNNMYYAFWNVIVYAITALLLYFVSQGQLEISVYLIIVPYLTTCTEQLNALFDKTNAVENMRVDVDRVNLILGLSDRQLLKYGRLNSKASGYNLGFIDVNYNNDDIHSDTYGKLVNVDLSFKMQSVNVIKGDRGSGKRLVFYMLRRLIKPQSGKVLLDNLDLFDYSSSTFRKQIYFCSSHPKFVNGTIKENLMLMSKNMKKVRAACERAGVLSYIENLQGGFDHQISEIRSSGMLFLIGLARAILSDCKVLMIYEIPQDAPESFHNRVKKFASSRKEGKTIILFTHSSVYDDIADLEYEIVDGKAKMIKARKSV